MSKKILFLLLFAILSIKSFSQIIYERGYFIDNLNLRTECLIRNVDWKNNPTKFNYKLALDSIVQIVDIKNVKEFGIYDASKYIRALVDIDRSSENINNLGTDRNPTYQKEQLFLKILVEGLATLYVYEGENITRFFFKVNNSEINQLVYKKYLYENQVLQNNSFRQQLVNNFKSQQISPYDVVNLRYSKTDLEKFFIKYNKVMDSEYTNYNLKQKRDLFNLTIRPGLNLSHLSIENTMSDFWNNDYGNEINFRFGVETEYIFPFNKNKWSIIIEPTFQYYYSDSKKETNELSGGFRITKVNYQSFELPVGLRHYFYLNDKSKIFANISYVIDFSYKSSVRLTRLDGSLISSLDITSRPNLSLGIGYKYKNRLSLEIRQQTKRQILSDYNYWKTNYGTMSIILGYTLF